MLERFQAHIEVVDKFERSALFHAACGGNNMEAVRTLLDLGANANNPAGWLGLTPVHFAALYGFDGCLQAMDSVGPGVNTPPDLQRAPLPANTLSQSILLLPTTRTPRCLAASLVR